MNTSTVSTPDSASATDKTNPANPLNENTIAEEQVQSSEDALDTSPHRLPILPIESFPLRTRQFRLPKTFAALQHRNFRLYVSSQLISGIGTWMQIIAQGWLVYDLSKSELALGIVGFASAIPALLITPWGGVIVDRVPLRKLLVITQTGSMLLAFILSILALTGVVEVWHVVLLAVGLGVLNAFDGPARQAFVVQMVGRADLSNAIALNSMTFNGSRILGPAVGGILLAAVGAGWCFFWNGFTFLAVIIGLLAMRIPPRSKGTETVPPWQLFTSGLTYVRQSVAVRGLLLQALILSLFGITYSTVLPAFVDQVLEQGPAAFGVLNTAMGIGALFTAYFIARFGENGQRGRWLSYIAVFFPVILALFAFNRFYPLAIGLSVLLGIGFMGQFTLINTLLQNNITDEMRGRVMSLYTLTFFGFTPFGNLLMGAAAEHWGLSEAVLTSALIALVLVIILQVRMPKLRALP